MWSEDEEDEDCEWTRAEEEVFNIRDAEQCLIVKMSYTRVVGGHPHRPQDRGGGGGVGGGAVVEEMERARETARRKGQMKRKENRQRLEIETARKQAGSEEENYLTFLQLDWDYKNPRYNYKLIAKMLKEIGILRDSVVSFNRDPNRQNQTEVVLKPGTVVDMGALTRALAEKYSNYEVNYFGHTMETIRVQGLPLTSNPENAKNLIAEALRPYVDKVINVNMGIWKLFAENKDENTDEYIEGKYDGNYHVQLLPRAGLAVPQFIPVGPRMTQANIVYVRGGYYFEKECNSCFKKGHFRNDEICEGAKSWDEHARAMREDAKKMLEDAGEEVMLTREEQLGNRIKDLEEELKSKNELAEEERGKAATLEEQKKAALEGKQILEEKKNEEVEILLQEARDKEREKNEEKEVMEKRITEETQKREALERNVEDKEAEMVKLKADLAEKEREKKKVMARRDEMEKEKQRKIDEIAEECKQLKLEKEEAARLYEESKQNYETLKEITVNGESEEEVVKMVEEIAAKDVIIEKLCTKVSQGEVAKADSDEEGSQANSVEENDDFIHDQELTDDKVFEEPVQMEDEELVEMEDAGVKRKVLERDGEGKESPENKKAKEIVDGKNQGDLTGYEEALEDSNDSIDLMENVEKEGTYLGGLRTKDQSNSDEDRSSQNYALELSQTQPDSELTDAQRIGVDGLENFSGGGTIPPDRRFTLTAGSSMTRRPSRPRSRSSSPMSMSLLAEPPGSPTEKTDSSSSLCMELHVPIQGGGTIRATKNFLELRDKFASMKE